MSSSARIRLASEKADFNRFLRREEAEVIRENLDVFRRIDRDRKQWILSEGYHNSTLTWYGRVQSEFGRKTPKLGAGSKVLDWGCSTGLTTIELANIHRESAVVGLEVRGYMGAFIKHVVVNVKANPTYLAKHTVPELRGRTKLPEMVLLPKKFLIADGFKAPFSDGSFDAVYCMNNLYYVMTAMSDHRRFERMRQVVRLVKPGGYLMVSDGGTIADENGGLDGLLTMVLKRENNEMVPKHISSDDPVAKERGEMLLEACQLAFVTFE